ncbi:MAG: molybdate ABC transporter substrate-binding protein [Defluviitaleaceae bacterium]|nr:molybdate ABC transporter substrate-binding protein [Defluviitaleaceae bacterium]
MKKSIFLLGFLMACASTPIIQPTTEISAKQSQLSGNLFFAAAASLERATLEIGRVFTQIHPNVHIDFTHASSGAIQSQIEEGAPIDIFMSASPNQTNSLYANVFLYSTPINVVRNELVLISPINLDESIRPTGFADVHTSGVELVAIGDPDSVPAGNFARQIFEYHGNVEEILNISTFGTNVTQVLDWVATGNAPVGVVFMTDAISRQEDVQIIEIAQPHMHDPAINPVAIVADTNDIELARAFVEFLFSDIAMSIFERYGFSPYQ